MNKRFYLLGLLSVFLLGTSVSCKDKDKDKKKSYCTQSPGNCESILAAKEFFLFKEGSWWVYEEETSLERDSVYVTEYVNSSSYDFDMRVKSALTDYEYHYWPLYVSSNGCSTNGSIQNKCIYINRSKGKPLDYVGESKIFFINYKIGDYIYTGSDLDYCLDNKIIIDDIQNTFTLNDLNFNKTIIIKELCSFVEGKQPTVHYYSKGVGIIRKEFLDSNEVWNLVSYHIAP